MALPRIASAPLLAVVAGLLVLACGGDESDRPLPAAAFLTALEQAGIEYTPTGDTAICSRHPLNAGVVYDIEGRDFVLFELPSADERGTFLQLDGSAQGTTIHGCRGGIERVFWNQNLVLTTGSGDDTGPFDPASDAVVARVAEVFTNVES